MGQEKTEEAPKMYYGAHEIVNVEDTEENRKRVEVKFAEPFPVGDDENGPKDVGEKFDIPEWELNVCSNTEPCDIKEHLTELRNRRANHIVKKLLEVLGQHDFRVEDFGYCAQKLLTSMQMSENKAILAAFGLGDKDDIRISHWAKAGMEDEVEVKE